MRVAGLVGVMVLGLGMPTAARPASIVTLTQAMSRAVLVADANHPYSNVDHSNDAGNDTGDSQVESLNEQQLDRNYQGPNYYGRPPPRRRPPSRPPVYASRPPPPPLGPPPYPPPPYPPPGYLVPAYPPPGFYWPPPRY